MVLFSRYHVASVALSVWVVPASISVEEGDHLLQANHIPKSKNMTGGMSAVQAKTACLGEGQNCQNHFCPTGLTCYVKDGSWAACRHECEPGTVYECDPPQYKTPWSCDVLWADPSCASEGQNCQDSLCPHGLTCYVKNEHWAACRRDCEPGSVYECDHPDFKTEWSCEPQVTDTTQQYPTPTWGHTPENNDDKDVHGFLSPHELMECGVETTMCMTEGDYDRIIDRVRSVMTQLGEKCVDLNNCKQADWAGCVLRFAGHDFMDFKDGEGGSDGCTNMHEPDNGGLQACLSDGEFGFSLKSLYKEFCETISLADFTVIAAEAVMTITRENAVKHTIDQGANKDPSSSIKNIPFKSLFRYGRSTKINCKQGFEMILPNPEIGCSEFERVYIHNLGLTMQQAVALNGVHTLGRAQIKNSGYVGAWSDVENSRRFNNDFYKSVVNKGWEQETVKGTGKHQYKRIDVGTDENSNRREMMLSTDLCTVYQHFNGEPINGDDHTPCCAWLHSDLFPKKGFRNVVHKEFCGMPCEHHPEKFMCNEPHKELEACCKPPRDEHGNRLDRDCGDAGDPTGPGVHANLLFASDEDAWLDSFLQAWEHATTRSHEHLEPLQHYC